MTTLQQPDAQEAALRSFLAALPEPTALRIRSLAHAWVAGGGQLQAGKLSCRLQAGSPAFTAATLFANQGGHATLELARIMLQNHGVSDAAWQAWADERADLRIHGFDPAAKYTALRLDALVPADLVRLVTGLRDLAGLVSR